MKAILGTTASTGLLTLSAPFCPTHLLVLQGPAHVLPLLTPAFTQLSLKARTALLLLNRPPHRASLPAPFPVSLSAQEN